MGVTVPLSWVAAELIAKGFHRRGVLLAVIAAISVWTPLIEETIASRWFSWPNLLYFSQITIVYSKCDFFEYLMPCSILAHEHVTAIFLISIYY